MILDKFRLDDKVALVTGASSGLGAAMAVALAEAGADVAAHGNTHDPAETCDAVRRLGRRALGLRCSLADKRTPELLISRTVEEFGRIDILVNNAGMLRRAPVVDSTDDDWDSVIEVNLSSAFRLSRLAGSLMIERGGGKIINIASLLSFQGGLNVASYAASKGGVAQMTKALANEWAARGVNVNAIAPGYMKTEITSALQTDPLRSRQILERIPAGRWGEPSDLAGSVVFMASAASDYLHGHILVVDGGWMGR